MRTYLYACALLSLTTSVATAFQTIHSKRQLNLAFAGRTTTALYSSNTEQNSTGNEEKTADAVTNPVEDEVIQRTTFDQAGAYLIDEEDKKRLEEMGDYDANPSYQEDSIARLREAIRARTASLGIEKSKVSADYIQKRQQAAMQAGSAAEFREQETSNTFGGIDLSQIRSSGDGEKQGNQWDESLPTMFYEPEDYMTDEEKLESDPLMEKKFSDQALAEIQATKWPTMGSAAKQILVMTGVVVFSMLLILGYDNVLRAFYTAIDFIPTPDEVAEYAKRFDGMDLPTGWMENMNEQDVAKIAEQVNSAPGRLPGL